VQKSIQKIWSSKFGWIWLLLLLAGINYLASDFHIRLDLTKEKRYSLNKATKDLLKNLDEDVQIDVFLKGQFPSGFKKLANSTEDFLRLLKDRTGKIYYRFISPVDEIPGTSTTYGDSLVKMGAVPINLTVQKKEGESSNIIFPVAVINFKGKQSLVNLYPGASREISQNEINSAEALLEYQFVKTLYKITTDKKPGVAYSTGNGEPMDRRTFDLRFSLENDFQFGTLDLKTAPRIPREVDVLLIVKPSLQFTEDEN
jgi:gliding-associated putative ABC transporter substrate-binding component GldG